MFPMRKGFLVALLASVVEFIVPVGRVVLGGRVVGDARLSITERCLFLIGLGPDGSYEERLLEIHGEESRAIIKERLGYMAQLLDELDALVLGVGRELGIDVGTGVHTQGDPVDYLLSRLRVHGDYLNLVGNGWRRILDSSRLGRVNLLLSAPVVYVTHSGNNITLNLVLEPIEDAVIKVSTYTENKVVGSVRIRVREDTVAKVDIRSVSALMILAQAKGGLGGALGEAVNRVSGLVKTRAEKLREIMASHVAHGPS
jgi:hypothetical protein